MKLRRESTLDGEVKSHSLATFAFLLIIILSSCKKENQLADEPIATTPNFVEAKGDLTMNGNHGPFIFRTNGGGTIIVDLTDDVPEIIITHDSFPAFHLEFWGVDSFNTLCGSHENLNGQDIKDRFGIRRSIIFPDGAKITMTSGPGAYFEPLATISIYDQEESHRINATSKTLIHSSTDATVAEQYDEAEADGEAGGFEFTLTGLLFFNDYTEDTPGNIITDHYNLGEIFYDIPNMVVDYYE